MGSEETKVGIKPVTARAKARSKGKWAGQCAKDAVPLTLFRGTSLASQHGPRLWASQAEEVGGALGLTFAPWHFCLLHTLPLENLVSIALLEPGLCPSQGRAPLILDFASVCSLTV